MKSKSARQNMLTMAALKLIGEYEGLRFLPTIKAFGAFIHFWISMAATVMTVASCTDHKTHAYAISGLAYIAILFSFSLRHIALSYISNKWHSSPD